jgi:hypothetical protein
LIDHRASNDDIILLGLGRHWPLDYRGLVRLAFGGVALGVSPGSMAAPTPFYSKNFRLALERNIRNRVVWDKRWQTAKNSNLDTSPVKAACYDRIQYRYLTPPLA